MHWIDWLIVMIPVSIVITAAVRTQRYVTGVADFLTAGRVAGRYVVCVAGGEAAMGLISLVAMFEAYYNSGFGYSFWNQVSVPIGILFTLTGYCIYRFRETRAMTMGQFFEMRYSRPFRIFAGILQSISGVINYAIFPAVSARFIIYYCDLPLSIHFLGMAWPTFNLLMLLFLSVALTIVMLGGQVTIMTCDCIQGLLNYPMMMIVAIAILVKFSWFHDMAPALLDRQPGMSMLNPFDVDKLRTFNLFYVFVGILSTVVNRMAWSGTQGYNTAALNAHEQKMGAMIGTWRAGFSTMMYILLAVGAYTMLNSPRFADKAAVIKDEIAWKAMSDVAPDPAYDGMERTPERVAERKAKLEATDPKLFQTMTTINNQMRVPVTLRYMLPIGITGLLCAIGIFLMVSTDTTYMHSWGSIIVQDVILPIRGRAFTPKQQIRLLRLVIAGVAAFAFLFSSLFKQVDFIMMFFAITGAIWLGGAGPCIVMGLYWKRGTTGGAWAALISGSLIATGGILSQQFWPGRIYPWLEHHHWVEAVSRGFAALSRPFEPFIEWRVTPMTFPVNSQEIYFIALVVSVLLYVGISLLSSRQAFNMDRLLHRGTYHREGVKIEKTKWTWKNAFSKIIAINESYTRGDKVIAYSVFIYSFVIRFVIIFLGIIIWNKFIQPWPQEWWAKWFFIDNVVITGIIGVISVFWFGIGGTRDLLRMFQRLRERVADADVLDDGRVEGHVSADDIARTEAKADPK